MLHKLMIMGSIASLGPWGGSVIYFIGPPLWLKDIALLKATRDCYIALDARITNNQLLACGWKKSNSTLNFYLYSPLAGPSVSLVKSLEIKPIKDSYTDREFSVKFLFWGQESLKVYKWSLDSSTWVKQEGKIFNLTRFCKSTGLSSFQEAGRKALTCKWGDKAGQEETWPALT